MFKQGTLSSKIRPLDLAKKCFFHSYTFRSYTFFHSYTFHLYTFFICILFSFVYFSFVYFSFVYCPFVYFSFVRGSHRRCSIKKVIFKNFAIFTGKHLSWSLFLIKLQSFSNATFLKMASNTGVIL